MITDYFGAIANGRLGPMRFIMLWFLLVALFVVMGLLIGAAIGAAEHMVGGDLKSAQKTIREALSIPAIVAFGLFCLLMMFAKLNIVAKRARDIGLPGWLSAFVLAGLIGGASQFADQQMVGGAGIVILLALAFVPSGAIR